MYGGIEYQSGENFLNPINPCEECQCKDKKVNCQRRACPAPGDCQHPYGGDCCPVCDGKDYVNMSLNLESVRLICYSRQSGRGVLT